VLSLVLGEWLVLVSWYGGLYRRNLSTSRLLCHLTNTDLRSLYWSNSSVLRDLLNRTCFGKLDNDTAYYQIFRASPSFGLSSYHFLPGIQPTWLVRWSETTTNAMVAAVQVNSERQLANAEFAEPEAMKPRSS